jgi:L-amino acid N-acyltransferase YncA
MLHPSFSLRKATGMEETIRIGIRMARPADAADIAHVYVESWRDTYAGILPDSGLVRMSKADQAASWSRMIKQSNLRNPVLVASDTKSNIYGFASAGPTREKSLPFEGEVFTLYVAPGWTGQGIGAGLLASIFRLFSKGGTNGMIIWALADNPSRFFYEAMGGQIVAERQHPMWGKSLREIGYGWRQLDLARPKQRVGRAAEDEPPL